MAVEPRVAVIGLGLLGTSLAMALKTSGKYMISGWTRRKEIRENLLNRNILDVTSNNVREVISLADITVLCLPVPEIIKFCRKYASAWTPGAIVTDVGSVKQVIVEAAEPALQKHGVEFIGGHPMAGTEQSGPEAAFTTLFDNATVFLTPTKNTSDRAVTEVEQLWKAVNANTYIMNVLEHDKAMAETSHLSHLAAWGLTLSTLADERKNPGDNWRACASGFRDVTRIASSSPRMWREIIESNRSAVLDSMKKFRKEWDSLTQAVESGDFSQLQNAFTLGRACREKWLNFRYPDRKEK